MSTNASLLLADSSDLAIDALVMSLCRRIGEHRDEADVDACIVGRFRGEWSSALTGKTMREFLAKLLLGVAALRDSVALSPGARCIVELAETSLVPGAFDLIDEIRYGAFERRIAEAAAAGLPVLEPGGLVALAEADGLLRRLGGVA